VYFEVAVSEKENPDIPAADPADNRTDTRRRGLGVRWDDRRRRPGERRARKERRDDEDRRKSERRLRVADRRVIDGSFSSPDRRSGEDRRKYDDRRYLQRRGEDRRKIPDRRKQKENPGQESGAADKAPGGSSPSPD
jgi:hypothetical protein